MGRTKPIAAFGLFSKSTNLQINKSKVTCIATEKILLPPLQQTPYLSLGSNEPR
jgi:hypothetical protein